MEPYINITKKFTKKFGSKVINRQYFHRKTGLGSFFDFLCIHIDEKKKRKEECNFSTLAKSQYNILELHGLKCYTQFLIGSNKT